MLVPVGTLPDTEEPWLRGGAGEGGGGGEGGEGGHLLPLHHGGLPPQRQGQQAGEQHGGEHLHVADNTYTAGGIISTFTTLKLPSLRKLCHNFLSSKLGFSFMT